MRRPNLLAPAVLFACAGAFIACDKNTGTDDDSIAVTGIEFRASDASGGTLSVGDEGTPATMTISLDGGSVTLRPTVLPRDATNKDLTWNSSDPDVATVSARGVVTPVAKGVTTITATTVDGGFEAKCEVTVEESDPDPIERMFINRRAAVLQVGQTFTITTSISPETALQGVTFTSGTPSVATVSENGVVTAVANGTTNITVVSDGVDADGKRVGVVCNITVSDEIARRCLTGTPEWGETLPPAGFATEQTWTIGDQIWSDAVTIEGSETKTTFSGAAWHTNEKGQTVIDGYKSDYRNNPDRKGDLFSWCAVMLHQDKLCTDGWRAPTSYDFAVLDIALGGNGMNGPDPVRMQKYIDEWGGEFNGWAPYNSDTVGNPIYSNQIDAIYWAAEEADADNGCELLFKNSGGINPAGMTGKGLGVALRCVKDK